MRKFFEILRAIKRQWKLWVIFPSISVCIVIYLTRNQEKTFTSNATISLNLETNGNLSLSGQAVKQYEIGIYFQNLIELSKSLATIDNVRLNFLKDALTGKHNFLVKKKTSDLLIDSAEVLNRVTFHIENNETINLNNELDFQVNELLNENNISREDLLKKLSISRIGNSNFIKIGMDSNNPEKSAYLIQLFISAIIHKKKYLTKNKLGKDKDLYEDLVVKAKKELNEKIEALENFKVENNIINLPEHTKAIVNQLVNLEIEKAQLYESRAANQQVLNRLQNTFDTGHPMPVSLKSNSEIIFLKEQLNLLNAKLVQNAFDQDQIGYRDSLKHEAAIVKKQINNVISNLIADVPYDVRSTRQELVSKFIDYQLEVEKANRTIPIIQGEINKLKEYTSKIASLESSIGSLEDGIQTAQQTYLQLLNKFNLAKTIEQGSAANDIVIIDQPTIPLKPQKSKRAIMVIAAGMGLFILIIGIIAAIELLDNTLKNVEDYELISLFNVLAVIPDFKDKLVVKDELMSNAVSVIISQQIKSIRKKILDLNEEERVILFTSSHQEEGKTWIATRLAESMVKTGFNILIIHADWMSKNKSEFGSSLLKEYHFDLNDNIDHLKESGILWFGNSKSSPYDIYDKERWKALKNQLLNVYDFVLVVSPPMSFSTDWQEWAQIGDNIINVFMANKIFRIVDKRNEKDLENCEKPVLGNVFNSLNVERMEGFLGDIPKKRSKFRLLMKQIVFRNLKYLKKYKQNKK
ncbi:exopolysaccharide transport family protein [Flexithrix dorotheae]|uniref:exopolysaccharide transport family protein n=1 Tax=Flexithrix dorotheae TaxID=70993 RepID=UPI00037DF102|nr:GNVR domain-containing protein [Flexithrix dorotheae]